MDAAVLKFPAISMPKKDKNQQTLSQLIIIISTIVDKKTAKCDMALILGRLIRRREAIN
jgi:hypothetical protein